MAIVNENHSEKQKAGLIGLPGLYKSVHGTTDYKNDTMQFIVVEEDHLTLLPPDFFGHGVPPPQQDSITLFNKFTLKQFLDRMLPNQLLIDLFSSDQTLMCQLLIQSLQALAFMNKQGIIHEDLTPQNIILELIEPSDLQQHGGPFHRDLTQLTADDFNFKFKVKLSEYLNIKMLGDIAF